MHSKTFAEWLNKSTNRWNIYREIVYANTKMITYCYFSGRCGWFLFFSTCFFVLFKSLASGDSDCKESTCNAADLSLIPGLGRSPGEGYSNPLQFSCLENSMDRGACSPWNQKESDMTGHRCTIITNTMERKSKKQLQHGVRIGFSLKHQHLHMFRNLEAPRTLYWTQYPDPLTCPGGWKWELGKPELKF